MKVASLTLSTLGSGKYAPTDKSNLANVKWSINWKEVMGEYYNTNKPCRVRCKLISSSSSLLNTANNLGTVRASFSSNYSNINNGLTLGIPTITQSIDTTTNTSQLIGMILATTLYLNTFGNGQSFSSIGGTAGLASTTLTLTAVTVIPIGSVIRGYGIGGYCYIVNQLSTLTYTMSSVQTIAAGSPILFVIPTNVNLPVGSLISGFGVSSNTIITAQTGPYTYTVSPTQNVGNIPILSNFIMDYLDLDTLGTNGVTISTPMNNDFNVMFLKPDEMTLMSNVPEYTILLNFDFDD